LILCNPLHLELPEYGSLITETRRTVQAYV